jgi:hypothetical protein
MLPPAKVNKPTVSLNNNNNNQVIYSQASWGRLEMKPHKPKKNRYKTKVKKKEKIKGDKKIKSKKAEKAIKR